MPVTATGSRNDIGYTPLDPEDPVCEDQGTADGEVTLLAAPDDQDFTPLASFGDHPPLSTITPYAVATAGDGVVTVGAGALRGRDARTGVELNVFDVSANGTATADAVGADGQAVMAHFGISRDDGRLAARGDVFSANAHIGTKSPDGSQGFNIGAAATIVSGEATFPIGDSLTVTVGAAASVGASLSLGIRDSDQDGKAEICGRVEYLWGIAGLCIEKPF
jgi:hypothetical protein